MFIDIHVHVRKNPIVFEGGKQRYASPEQLLKRYEELGIEKAVILPGGAPECQTQKQSEEEVLEICRQYPDRFIPFCNVDPRSISNSPDAPLDDLLCYYKQQGCRGIGEITANLSFSHPMVQNLFKHAEKLGLPVTFHIGPQVGGCYGLYDEPGLPQLERTLQKYPGLYFLGHSQPFWAEISQLETPADRYGYPRYPVKKEGVVPKLFRRYKNLLGDLSAYSGFNAISRDPVYGIDFLNEFQDRLFFGTDICAPDTPVWLVDYLKNLVEEGKISQTVFNKIAFENAKKLLNI
ncbi:MAG: amidohydrolase family protein [Candidatus Omnitrophica bacterium]|nr:amidohydrolase family protein [Candidatus Omnitrophota bacterium]